MLRSHFGFAYVLYIIFISSVSSATFDDSCSDDLPCHYPFICSNSSKCICPLSSSFWNTKQNTCLSCPPRSMEWKNEKCLLFIAPYEGGIIYQRAKNACLIHSAQLLQINNHQDFVYFQYKIDELFESENANVFIEYLRSGVWINFTDSTEHTHSYDWCDGGYEKDLLSLNNCVRVMKKYSRNDNDTSLCISYVHCYQKLPYICEKLAQVQDAENDMEDEERSASFIGNFVADLLDPFSQSQPTQQPPSPQILYVTNSPQLLAQANSNHTALYIGLIVGFIVLVSILACCGLGGFFLWKKNNNLNASTSASNFHQRENRTSVDSTDSASA